MNEQRNKELTLLMGECWHEFPKHSMGCIHCIHVLKWSDKAKQIDFSTPDGFFKLWEWAQKQEWWSTFLANVLLADSFAALVNKYINPDRFADAVWAYLKDKA